VSLEQWRKAMGYKEKPAAPKPPESKPAPEPEPADSAMTDEERAWDLGNVGPASIEEQEVLEDVRAAEARNPGGVAFARMIVESMNENDRKNGRTR